MNALDRPTLEELRDRLAELGANAEARVVVLTGAGDRAFIAGADIKYMSGLSVEEATGWGGLGHECGRLLEEMPKPTIAAINGFALGGGCELALACDLRYAAPNAKLGQPEINLGIIPGWGGTQRLARATTVGIAKELILTGRLVDADEALRLGLVNGVADPVLDQPTRSPACSPRRARSPWRRPRRPCNRSLQGDHDGEPPARGRRLRRAVRERGREGGPHGLRREARARFTGR